jgi:hypothetical protein
MTDSTGLVAAPYRADRRSPGARETTAVVLLAGAGIVVPVIGWLVGIGLLWSSRLWTIAEKLIATVLTPGMLLIPLVLLLDSSSDTCRSTVIDHNVVRHCGGGSSTLSLSGGVLALVIALLILIPIATAIVLYLRAGQRAANAS